MKAYKYNVSLTAKFSGSFEGYSKEDVDDRIYKMIEKLVKKKADTYNIKVETEEIKAG